MSSISKYFANFLDYQRLELLGKSLEFDPLTASAEIFSNLPNLSQDDLTDSLSTAKAGLSNDNADSLLNTALNLATLSSDALSDSQRVASAAVEFVRQWPQPQIVPRAAFTTLAASGQRFENNRDANGKELKWTRSSSKSDGTQLTNVTFAFDDSFTVSGLDTSRAKTLFANALQTWADYTLLDFLEIKDPGSADAVDILAQSDRIDGAGQTLALAYFPTVGDITFDASETWSEALFLETAVHEIGHSLGLDHEDDTSAIMNSIFVSRFASTGKPFLLQDDIDGIRSLYGVGKGSVKTLGDTSTAPGSLPSPPLGIANLVVNGSFEEVPLKVGEHAQYRQIKGWSTIDGVGFEVDRRSATVGRAAEGTAWVELDAAGRNNTIGQNIDTLTGQTYAVSVDFSDGGRPERTTSIEVFWEGRKIDTISGGGKGLWRNFRYEVKGGDRTASTLAFRAMGPSDNVGGFIDNISVTAKSAQRLTQADASLGVSSPLQTNGLFSLPTSDLTSGLAPMIFPASETYSLI